MPYKGSKNYHGPSRAKVTSSTGDGNDYAADKDDQVIFANTNDSVLTVTLPDTSEIQTGHTVEVVDEGGNAGTNNITVTQNGSENINGAATDTTVSTNYAREVYVWNGTQWLNSAAAP